MAFPKFFWIKYKYHKKTLLWGKTHSTPHEDSKNPATAFHPNKKRVYFFFRADYCCVCIHKLMSIQGPKNFKCPSLGSVPFLNRSNNSTNYFGIFMTFFTDVVLLADNSNNISWRMVFVKVIISFFQQNYFVFQI